MVPRGRCAPCTRRLDFSARLRGLVVAGRARAQKPRGGSLARRARRNGTIPIPGAPDPGERRRPRDSRPPDSRPRHRGISRCRGQRTPRGSVVLRGGARRGAPSLARASEPVACIAARRRLVHGVARCGRARVRSAARGELLLLLLRNVFCPCSSPWLWLALTRSSYCRERLENCSKSATMSAAWRNGALRLRQPRCWAHETAS